MIFDWISKYNSKIVVILHPTKYDNHATLYFMTKIEEGTGSLRIIHIFISLF